jgi:hypothetical protein
MTVAEALQFLEVDHIDDASEALEEKLFVLKKEILQKPLLKPLLRARIEQLNVLAKLEKEVLGVAPDSSVFWHDLVLGEDVVENWKRYNQSMYRWRVAFMGADSVKLTCELIPIGQEIECRFAASVPKLQFSDEEPVFGRDPDPMVLEKGFRKMEQEQIKSFQEVKKQENLFDKAFLVSLDRLSMLSKYL